MAGSCLGIDGQSLPPLHSDAGAEPCGWDGLATECVHATVQCASSCLGPGLWGSVQVGAGSGGGSLALPDADGLHSSKSGAGEVGEAEGGAKCAGLSVEQCGGRVCAAALEAAEVAGCGGWVGGV